MTEGAIYLKKICRYILRMIMNLAYLRSVDRWCRARRHGPVATQRRSTSTEQLFCANGVASTSKRRERSSLTPRASLLPPRTTDATLQGTLTRITPLVSRVHTPSLRPSSSHLGLHPLAFFPTSSRCLQPALLRPRGYHPRGTCAENPVQQNSSRRAARIGKNGPWEKEEPTGEEGKDLGGGVF